MANLKAGASPTVEDIYEITGVISSSVWLLFFLFTVFAFIQRVPNVWIEGLLEKCATGLYDAVQLYIDNFIVEGFSVSQLLNQLHEKIIYLSEFSPKQKTTICEKIAAS